MNGLLKDVGPQLFRAKACGAGDIAKTFGGNLIPLAYRAVRDAERYGQFLEPTAFTFSPRREFIHGTDVSLPNGGLQARNASLAG